MENLICFKKKITNSLNVIEEYHYFSKKVVANDDNGTGKSLARMLIIIRSNY